MRPAHNKNVERARPTRFWLWPNLLSLDAPVVAVLWQILFARCFQAPIDAPAALLLLLTVWLIYTADRTLDAWNGACHSPRHEFYRRRWRGLLPAWLAVFGLACWLAAEHLAPRGMARLLYRQRSQREQRTEIDAWSLQRNGPNGHHCTVETRRGCPGEDVPSRQIGHSAAMDNSISFRPLRRWPALYGY